MKSVKVIHVVPHLGGGIGTAYAGITIPGPDMSEGAKIEHEILLLEKPRKTPGIERIRANGIPIFIEPTNSEVKRKINDADLVQIGWWNHPLNSKFLAEFPEIPVRLLCWSHVSGCTYPFLRRGFLNKFAKTLFTTPFSFENPEIASWNEKNERTDIVYGLGDLSRFLDVQAEKHDDFRIGYAGTLDFAKMHPDFVRFCAAASRIAKNIRFVLIGDDENKEEILRRADDFGIGERFEFTGFCRDMPATLARLDCMAHLLNPAHFGTTENVMLESMAAGIPLVAMNRNTEKYIIENNETGFLVEDANDFQEAIRILYECREERTRIARNARQMVRQRFSCNENRDKLLRIYRTVLDFDKKTVSFADMVGERPSDWFLYFIEHEKNRFRDGALQELPEIFRGCSKGSVIQFATYFPEDETLATWAAELSHREQLLK